MISPAYMLPKSRSECDNGLDTYSTALKAKLTGQSTGWPPNGEATSSCAKPPAPFARNEKMIIRAHTDSESANVVLTSAVGTGRKCPSPRWLVIHVTKS